MNRYRYKDFPKFPPIPSTRATMADSSEEQSQESSAPFILAKPPNRGRVVLQVPDSGFLALPNVAAAAVAAATAAKTDDDDEDANAVPADFFVRARCCGDGRASSPSPRFTHGEIAPIRTTCSVTRLPTTTPTFPLASHISGDFMAFVVQGFVRVFNYRTRQELLLNKIFEDSTIVQDVAFARILDRIVLAVVDSDGTIVVIELHHDTLNYTILLEMFHDSVAKNRRGIRDRRRLHRLVWCPYVPASPEEEDLEQDYGGGSLVLAVVHICNVDVYNVGRILEMEKKKHPRKQGDPLEIKDGMVGHVQLSLESSVDFCELSLDCQAMVLVCRDRRILFYSYDLDSDFAPKLVLGSWRPLGDDDKNAATTASFSGIWFLDDKSLTVQPDKYGWGFVVIGSRGNSVLSLWSCKSWSKIQTCRISMESDDAPLASFCAAVDPRANFMVLAHSAKPVLFVVRFEFSVSNGVQDGVRFSSVREISLPFIIVSISVRNHPEIKKDLVVVVVEASRNPDDVEMFAVHKGGVQYCKIALDVGGDDASAFTPVRRTKPEEEVDRKEEMEQSREDADDTVDATDVITVIDKTAVAAAAIDVVEAAAAAAPVPPTEKTPDNNANEGKTSSPTTLKNDNSKIGKISSDLARIKALLAESKSYDEKRLEEIVTATVGDTASNVVAQQLQQLEDSLMDRFNSALRDVLDNTVPRIVSSTLDVFAKELVEKGATVIKEEIVRNVDLLYRNELVPDMTKNLHEFVEKTFLEEKERGSSVVRDLRTLVVQGKFNEALSAALATEDPRIVVATCKNVDLASLLVNSSGQQQPVVVTTENLFSILRCLGRDLEKETSSKVKYLKDILLSFDLVEPSVKIEYARMKKVLLEEADKALGKVGGGGESMAARVMVELRVLKMICQN